MSQVSADFIQVCTTSFFVDEYEFGFFFSRVLNELSLSILTKFIESTTSEIEFLLFSLDIHL